MPTRQVSQKKPSRILVLSLCDGIGAVLQAAIKNWGPAARLHAWEIIPDAIKVSSARAPGTSHHGDLRQLSDDELKDILEEHEFLAILVAAGFPCQNTSNVRGADRPGIQGKKSGLVFDITALIH